MASADSLHQPAQKCDHAIDVGTLCENGTLHPRHAAGHFGDGNHINSGHASCSSKQYHIVSAWGHGLRDDDASTNMLAALININEYNHSNRERSGLAGTVLVAPVLVTN